MSYTVLISLFENFVPVIAMLVIVYVSATKIIKELQKMLTETSRRYDKLQIKIHRKLTNQLMRNENVIKENTDILMKVADYHEVNCNKRKQ